MAALYRPGISAPIRPSPSSQGKHEYDGQLPDWSETGLPTEIARLRSAIAAAQAFDPRRLTREQRFERDYLIARARGDLFWLETADQPHTNPAYYMDNGLDPSVYVTRPYAPAATRLRAFIAYLRGGAARGAADPRQSAHAAAGQLHRLRQGRPSAASPNIIRATARAAFAEVARPGAAGRAARRGARRGAGDARPRRLARERSGRTRPPDFALGAERFAQMLRDTEMVDVPLAELEAIGRADLLRNQQALQAACARYAPGATMPACMDRMNANKPRGRRRSPAARAQLAGLRAFIEQQDLVSIPGTEEAHVEESPPYNRQNSAYIDIPGPYERGLPSVYYIAPPDPSWTPEVQAGFVPGETDLLFTSVHEVWPGHFLNFLHSNRSPFTVRAGLRRLCLRRGLGPLCRGDDVGRRARRRRPGDPYRPAFQRPAARLPLPVGDRHAHAAG